jgi:glutamate N-acetyltransferase/amino-acid N-acetyltransferase
LSITQPKGFMAAATTAGIKPSGKPDLALLVRTGTGAGASAACYTRNQIVGAPVEVGRAQRAAHLSGRAPALRAVLVNAGNSNAATGERGRADARACMAAAARVLGCAAEEVLPSSTGVIGRLLPVEKITAALPGLAGSLAAGPEADAAFARAIMTTDLVPKTSARVVKLAGGEVRLGAAAKGSGMIAPRLDSALGPPAPAATMLAFITTDAVIASAELQRALEGCAAETFDCISVDNHPSCSDTVVSLASGASGVVVPKGGRDAGAFADALRAVCEDLARQIIADGEGATRTFTVRVSGAPTREAALLMAREVVNSPLVKCAIHGKDPNWGRIVTAAGNAGVPIETESASLLIGPVEVYAKGVPIPAALTDPRLGEAMGSKHVEVALTVGRGPGAAHVTGCDLSAAYVSINADYTT